MGTELRVVDAVSHRNLCGKGTSCCCCRCSCCMPQNAATHAREEVSSRVELLRDQVASLEARLGVPYVSDSSTTG